MKTLNTPPRWKRILRPGDALIIAAALLLALAPLLSLLSKDETGAFAVVSFEGEVIYRAPVAQDAIVDAGAGNVFLIKGGEIAMHSALCPDGLCLKMHAQRPGESVVCLPNKAAAWVEGSGGLDGVAY